MLQRLLAKHAIYCFLLINIYIILCGAFCLFLETNQYLFEVGIYFPLFFVSALPKGGSLLN